MSIAAGGVAALYLALTIGAQAVAGLGIGVARAPAHATRVVFVGVRADQADLGNAQLLAAVRRRHVTLIVDAPTARRRRRLLAALAADGVDIANGGWGHTHWMRWRRAHDDCVRSAAEIADDARVRVREFVPARSVDAFDQFYCRVGRRHERLVEPTAVLVPGRLARLRGRGIYVLNGCRYRPLAVAAALQTLADEAGRSKLGVRSFVALR